MMKKLLAACLLFAMVLAPSYGFSESENQNADEQKAPRGDLPGWKQIFVDDFEEYGDVPVGSFSDCNHSTDNFKEAYCGGLTGKLKERWWAYPKNWPDTAKQRNYSLGGVYNPAETVSIQNGQLKVKMFNDGGENQVAALVPKATIGQTYGRYVIRFKAETTPGYKLAWLLWPDVDEECPFCEIDFPELELDSEISGFMHHQLRSEHEGHKQDVFPTGEKYGKWHTAVIEWKPGKVQFFLDGKLVRGMDPEGNKIDASTQGVPDQPMTWVIQSESALDDRAQRNEVVAQKGSSATILIDWVAAYQYTGDKTADQE